MTQPAIVNVQSDAAFVERSLAFLVEHISAAIAARGECVLGLCGGGTPTQIYEELGKANIDWSKVYVFLLDERYVPADHKDSNQGLVQRTLLPSATLPQRHVLFPDTTLPLEACIAQYDHSLRELVAAHGGPDIVTIGMGEDGHITSLFPPLTDGAFGSDYVIHTTTDRFAARDRISTAFALLDQVKQALFLLKGDGKKRMWEEMMISPEDARRWPAKRVMQTMPVTAVVL